MRAAKTKRKSSFEQRLLVLSRNLKAQTPRHLRFTDLTELLIPGDVLVVNDAATLPASFYGIHTRTGKSVEMRLAASLSKDKKTLSRWLVVFFGEGDWRTPTERRLQPPAFRLGDRIEFGTDLTAEILRIPISSNGFSEIEFKPKEDHLWNLLYRNGRPIQYTHLERDLDLWDIQTLFATSPVSLEPPSAAFPFSWGLISDLKRKGVIIVRLTHAAGISSTGDTEIDRQLPLPEKFWISAETAEAINRAISERRRIIAIGTSVTRALESAVDEKGTLLEGAGITDLFITPLYRHKVVNGILTGFHERGASHMKLLGSFTSRENLELAYREAESRGYLNHEYGDSCLILP